MSDQTGWRNHRRLKGNVGDAHAGVDRPSIGRSLDVRQVGSQRSDAAGRPRTGSRLPLAAPLAERLTEVFPSHRRPGHRQVAGFLIADAGFQRACRQHTFRWRLTSDDPPEMFPTSGGPRTWQVPDIVTAGGLADWLGVTTSHLDWFADRRGDQRRRAPGRLSHYRYHWLAKRTGGSARLIEAPKWRLQDNPADDPARDSGLDTAS